MKAVFITIAVCLFTLCGTGCTQICPPHRTALRYDGLYYSSAEPNQNDYLRFYSDGTVVGADVFGTRFKTMPDWLQRGRGCAQGHYQLVGSVLTFSTAEPLVAGTHEYRGRVAGNSLFLHWTYRSKGLSGDEVFHFLSLYPEFAQ